MMSFMETVARLEQTSIQTKQENLDVRAGVVELPTLKTCFLYDALL